MPESNETATRLNELTLPYPPSLNTAYRVYRNRIILSKIARKYVDKVKESVSEQNTAEKLTGRLDVTYFVYPPDKRKRDIANTEKLVSDCLTKSGVWNDDSQIDKLLIVRCQSDYPGRIEVKIKVLN
jgi:crossover junction endodeoxyribonuclease RusA